jgi:hypothetical protein
MRGFLIVGVVIVFCGGQAFGKPTGPSLTLEQMVRQKFTVPQLSKCEERVVQHASDGTKADCSNLGGGNDPAEADGTPNAAADKWPGTRNIRADLIRWLLVDREASKRVDPHGVLIQGARIVGLLDLSFTNSPVPLALWGCRLEQDLVLSYAKMPVLNLDGSWTAAITADGLSLEGDIFLRNGFRAEGEVRLPGATIGGDLDATGGTFKNLKGSALTADGAKIAGAVFMKPEFNAGSVVKNKFAAQGEVRLLGAKIGGNLEASGGTFHNSNGNALNADRVQITGSVHLRKGFAAEGKVALAGAEIKGQLAVDDAWLDLLDLDSANIAGPFFWVGIHTDAHPDFPSKKWKPYLNLNDTKVGALADEKPSWPEKGGLILDGFVYDRIAAGPTDATTRLDWLHLQPDELGFRPQPYEQLIAVLRQMGHEDHVGQVAIAKQWDLRKQGNLSWLGWIKNWFLYIVVGYGYRAWLAFVWMAILVGVGTRTLSRAHSAGVLVPSDRDAYKEYQKTRKVPAYYPGFHALLYSLDVVLPFDLGQKAHWRLLERSPGDRAYRRYALYSLFQLVTGWALLLVAAAVPAGLIK